ncbi:MAG: S8 family serine peptidase, partial [Methylococcales bacterium]
RTARQWNFTGKPSGAFEGKIAIDTRGMVPDDCFSFRAIVHTSKGDRIGDYRDYCVTGLPLDDAAGTVDEINSGFTAPDGTKVAKELVNVTFKPGTPESRIVAIVAAHGGTIIGAMPATKHVEIRLVPPPASFEELMAKIYRLSEEPEVYSIGPAYGAFEINSIETTDPDRSLQPHLKQIRADQAWYLERGMDQTIAVLDTGIDRSHPDLSSKLYVDPVIGFAGRDFADHDFNPSDPHSHGTHVAGIAAAMTDNGLGIAGIGWNAKILPVKVQGDDSEIIKGQHVAQALEYVDRFTDIRIVNMSFGASERILGLPCKWLVDLGWLNPERCDLVARSGDDAAKFYQYKTDVCNAVNNSYTNHLKFLVAAAGNNGHDEKEYPAGCDGAVAVAAVDEQENKLDGSSFGDWVHIAAPGDDIYSTYPTYPTASGPAGSSCVTSTCDYGKKSGTSQASPMVAGAAALVLSQNPGMMPRQIRERLKQTAKKLTSPYDLGAGLLNVFGAVFNPSFEAETLEGWEHFTCVPNALTIESDRLNPDECTPTNGLDVLKTTLGAGFDTHLPRDGKQMAYLTTLPDNNTANKVKLRRRFQVQPGVSIIPIQIDYAMISDAYFESFGSASVVFDDRLLVTMESMPYTLGGFDYTLIDYVVDIKLKNELRANWQRIFDYSIPGGDSTLGWTRWRTIRTDLMINHGSAELVIRLDDADNTYNDTNVIIDNIRLTRPDE